MTTVALPQLTAVELGFKQLIWDPMVKAGEMWLEGEVPALALPVIKEADEAMLQWVADYTFSQLRLLVDLAAIQLRNPILQSKWEDIAFSLLTIGDSQGIESDAFKQAIIEAEAALGGIVQYAATTGPAPAGA